MRCGWLLANGIIPCQDSGRQTRRFPIRLEDIITFLEWRDAGLLREELLGGFRAEGQNSGMEWGSMPLLM